MVKYTYLLTPKGIHKKSLLKLKFLERKREEIEVLRYEITQLEQFIRKNNE